MKLFEWQFVYVLQVYYALYGVLSYDELPFCKVVFCAHSARHERHMKKDEKQQNQHVYSLARVCMHLFCDKPLCTLWKYYIFTYFKQVPPPSSERHKSPMKLAICRIRVKQKSFLSVLNYLTWHDAACDAADYNSSFTVHLTVMFIQGEQERFEARDFTVSLPCRELELISKYLKIANQWKDENNHDDCQRSLQKNILASPPSSVLCCVKTLVRQLIA